ncbi:hypothetical protein [Dietzia alimentaria]|uniref:hypothetical protein n=1 Tax=Dietzia alimentaria TaxID=665550 RepID=UPI00114543DA|nr:hypothetical protein [Dietzia alimentaria]
MSTVIAAVISAATAFSVALISSSRKAPEDRIIALREVIEKASPSEWQAKTILAAIDREYERIESPDYSSWLLVWAVLGAVGLGFFSLVSQAYPSEGLGRVVPIAGFVFMGIFVLILVAVILQEFWRTQRWWRARKINGRQLRGAAGDDEAKSAGSCELSTSAD